jgi:hypothetical protein
LLIAVEKAELKKVLFTSINFLIILNPSVTYSGGLKITMYTEKLPVIKDETLKAI